MTGKLVLLSCACVLWCSLHSLLICRPVSSWLKERLGRCGCGYRLLYNTISLITLLPLIIYIHTHPGDTIFSWDGFIWLRLTLVLTALACFYGGSRHYDLYNFLGLNQLRSGDDKRLLSGEQVFSRQGILGIIRHPWYAGSLFFVWSVLPEYSSSACTAGIVFSLYLVIGARIEEYRLLTEFGGSYRQYQEEVSMFIPWKWLKMKISGESNGAG